MKHNSQKDAVGEREDMLLLNGLRLVLYSSLSNLPWDSTCYCDKLTKQNTFFCLLLFPIKGEFNQGESFLPQSNGMGTTFVPSSVIGSVRSGRPGARTSDVKSDFATLASNS